MPGSTGRERELAKIKATHAAHFGCSGDLLSCLHEIYQDGPQHEGELAVRHRGQDEHALPEGVVMTDFCRSLARSWVQRHGRRFRIYAERKDQG